MIDLDIDTGAETIARLMAQYQDGKVGRDDIIKQLISFTDEATQAIDLTSDDRKKIEVYVLTLLRHVETHELDSETAAADLCEFRRAAEFNDPSFLALIELPED